MACVRRTHAQEVLKTARDTWHTMRSVLWIALLAVDCVPYARAERARCPSYLLKECAGRGYCERDGTCSCSTGYAGEDCAVDLKCDPENTRLPCSGRGFCHPSRGCVCAEGYHGALCETDAFCPKDAMGRPCSAVGICAAHTCLCPSHRSGAACEHGSTASRSVPSVEEQ